MGKQREIGSQQTQGGAKPEMWTGSCHHLIIFVLLKKPQQNGKERDRGLSEKGYWGWAFTGEAAGFLSR